MAIIPIPTPEGMREAVQNALSLRLGRAQLGSFTGTIGLTTGLPRYLLGGDGKPSLDHARLTAWDFFALAEDQVALASMTVADEQPSFGGINSGDLAACTLEAATLGEAELAGSEARYTPIIVSAPDAGILSLVFRSEDALSQRVDLLVGTTSLIALTLETGLEPIYDRIAILRHDARASDAASWPAALDG